MQRLTTSPRSHWQEKVEAQGFHFHTVEEDGQSSPYWDEGTYYRFSAHEVDLLETASYALNGMCLQAVEHVLANDLFDQFRISKEVAAYVRTSWEEDEHTVYGRFDLAYDGAQPPKLLEYNADTPTALLEAAVVQWFWFREQFPGADQFNSIHERLLEIWSILKNQTEDRWYFTSLADHVEDYLTVHYLRDTALQAGLETAYLPIEQIGWNSRLGMFVDEANRPLRHVFKLYPWEWLVREAFGPHLLARGTRWLEAPWKMLLSNKALLPILYHLFPDSPYLLKTAWEPFGPTYVRKPILGREGANITLVYDGKPLLETDGVYGASPCIYQEFFPLPSFDGRYAVLGSWMVNGSACGMGIREDRHVITQNTSCFVPHIIL